MTTGFSALLKKCRRRFFQKVSRDERGHKVSPRKKHQLFTPRRPLVNAGNAEGRRRGPAAQQ